MMSEYFFRIENGHHRQNDADLLENELFMTSGR